MTTGRRPTLTREDLLLALCSVLLAFAGAAAFAAYRAVSPAGDNASERLVEFAKNLLWPGVLIFGGVAVAVWFGWKANID